MIFKDILRDKTRFPAYLSKGEKTNRKHCAFNWVLVAERVYLNVLFSDYILATATGIMFHCTYLFAVSAYPW